MAPSYIFNTYIWLIDTVRSGKLTLEDIDARWRQSDLNDTGEAEFPRRKFHRYRNDILTLFHLNIVCARDAGNYYYIQGEGDIRARQARQWIENAYSLQVALNEAKGIENRLVYEQQPKGTEYLSTIVRAMKRNCKVELLYKPFNKDEYTTAFAPYCLKMFRQRWYIVGEADNHQGEIRIYALDRVGKVSPILNSKFSLPRHFDAQQYFEPFYGAFTAGEATRVVIRANKHAVPFLDSLPLHSSQVKLEETDDAATYEFFIAPTFDFEQELRTFGAEIQVIEPQSLAQRLAAEARSVLELYSSIPNN